MFVVRNSAMKNRIEQSPETRKNGDVFSVSEDNFGVQATNHDSDCWSHLWRRIKVAYYRFLRQKKKGRRISDCA